MKKIIPFLLLCCLLALDVTAQNTQPVFIKIVTTEIGTKIQADVVLFSKDSILGFQLPILWDEAVVKKPTAINSPSLSNFTFTNSNIQAKSAIVVWYNEPPLKGLYLNGTIIMTATFDRIGTGDPKIRIENAAIPIEFVTANGDSLSYQILGIYDEPYTIKGRVVADLNKDCTVDGGDTPFSNVAIKASNPNEGDFYTYSNTDGSFYLYTTKPNLPYTLTVLPKDTAQWVACLPSLTTIPLQDSSKVSNFALKAKKDCITSDVQVSTPWLRRCFSNTYSVNYQNTGTLNLPNAYIVLSLDKDLEMQSATLPYTDLGNHQYQVNLGNLVIGAVGTFSFVAKLSCQNTVIGQTHCVEARLFPENSCLGGKPKLNITPTCANGKVQFKIENQGNEKADNLEYLIVEDDMIFKQGIIPTLTPAQTLTQEAPANGAVWRMEIWKNKEFIASTFYEACGTNVQGTFSTGFPMQYSNVLNQSNIGKSCQQSIGSYDPNDKQGLPLGVSKNHYIDQNVAIDYLIRFQNTGTDTAFNILVEDKIDVALLDLSKIRILSSSHPMTWSIKNKNTLLFDFKNIMLPDSFKNEKLSHGFVRFSIAQHNNNPLQSVIKNKAGIYFDFNPPILTNETFHTVGRDFLSVSTTTIYVPNVSVVVKPNPFSTEAIIEVLGVTQGNLSLEVFDLLGRKIQQQDTTNGQFEVQKHQFQEGLYWYRIYKGDVLVANGKFVVQ
jgi:Secretion system C-terminal sorting domain